jgi:hypothetical protein
MHGADVVQADGGACRRRNGVDQRAGVGAKRAEIDQPLDTQREEAPFGVERQFADQIGAASVVIAGDRLRSCAEPFHRPAGSLGREHDGEKLGIDFVPDAKAPPTSTERMRNFSGARPVMPTARS